jgi:Chemotaxis signal transduction protein
MSQSVNRTPFEILARYERLSLAHASDTQDKLEAPGLWRGIGFRVGSRLLVSGIDEINELLAVPVLTPVPGTQPWLLGVANVRGNLVPVVDFARFLFGERTQQSDRTRLLVVRQGAAAWRCWWTRCSASAPWMRSSAAKPGARMIRGLPVSPRAGWVSSNWQFSA